MAAIDVPCTTIFQEARDRINSEMNNIIQCLNKKQVEMFAEIASLEKEFKDKQQQMSTGLNKLNSMKARAEEELGDNTLIEVRQNVLHDLQQGIDKLTLQIESTREPDYQIEIWWNTNLLSSIFDSKLGVVDMAQENTPVPLAPPVPLVTRPLPAGGVNPKKRRNRKNRAQSATRDEDSVPERPLTPGVETREFRNGYKDSNSGFVSIRGRWSAVSQRKPYTDYGDW